MAEFCPKFKEKKFCDTKIEVMEMMCAETCGYCPKGKSTFYRNLFIIN